MLEANKLKEISLAKKNELNAQRKLEEEAARVLFTPAQIEGWVQKLEESILEYAALGYMQLDYLFDANEPIEAIYVVANAFKHRNPSYMVITSEGSRKIIVTWDGNNYV